MSFRAACYARYSSDSQRHESIAAQARAIEEYCKRRGYTLVASYVDEALTATSDRRPQFQRMIEDSKTRTFDVVIVHKLDRFARDRYDSAYYKRQLRTNGVRLESVLENLDDSPESVVLESVLEGMAEYYSKNLAREVRKGLRENAMKAKHTGGPPPYGYRVNPQTKELEIDEAQAPAVRYYFEAMAAGKSLQQITDEINGMGYRTRRGNPFTKNSFWEWSQNRKYMGVYTWDVHDAKNPDGTANGHRVRDWDKQTVVEGGVPPIVTKELWERVNATVEGRRRAPGEFKAQTPYLLSGKIRCGECNEAYVTMSTTKTRGEKRYRNSYYRCRGCKDSIPKDRLEERVIEILDEKVFSAEALQRIVQDVKRALSDERRALSRDEKPVRKEIGELSSKIDRMLDAIADGTVTTDLVRDRLKAAADRKTVLEAELERMNKLKDVAIPDEVVTSYLTTLKDRLHVGNDTERKAVISSLVEWIEISHDREARTRSIKASVLHFIGSGGGI
ncbi:recombinase family protein [Alicyclobacillus sp. ALC3]|uniref:recombinase family protein n=1 Tax=Alicyclobacillus sp. ALC3 TaxID=2796143 RepID=UPI0023789413|nr:recombinase family protein [Alicyclobacillus sp. ALC3]WDL97844.1 recombinase family protein [Alicyclobacillus sp. ALC3]